MHTTCELSADNSGVMHAATLLNSIRSAVAQYQHCQTVERVACRMHRCCLPSVPCGTQSALFLALLLDCFVTRADFICG